MCIPLCCWVSREVSKFGLPVFYCIFWSSSPGFDSFLALYKLKYLFNSRFITNKIYLHSSATKVKALVYWTWTGSLRTNPLHNNYLTAPNLKYKYFPFAACICNWLDSPITTNHTHPLRAHFNCSHNNT